MASYEAVPQTEILRKGPWHEEEDEQLIMCVTHMGERRWDYIARKSGLNRSGKSCRLRWLNYLRPNIKHGDISIEEEEVIIQLHELWGNKWSRIARRLPGRTDNEIKNYWRTHLKRKIEAQKHESSQSGINIVTQDYLIQKVDVKGQRYDSNNRKCGENNFESSNALFDAVEFSDSVFTSSPYEVWMLDWMAELSDDQSTSGHSNELSCTESCYCFKEMICEDNDETWGWSGSIWDMN